MSVELFTDAMSELNEKYVMEAATYKAIGKINDNYANESLQTAKTRSRPVWTKWGAIAACLLLLVGCTFAPFIIEMISGRTVEWDENHLFTSGAANSMAEVRDNRVYFTLDNTDITDYCSATTYFRYDFTDEQGISHVFLIGGEIDTIGWTEILFFEDGKRLSHSDLITEDGNPPVWYVAGNEAVNADYGYVSPNGKTTHSYEIELEPEVVED